MTSGRFWEGIGGALRLSGFRSVSFSIFTWQDFRTQKNRRNGAEFPRRRRGEPILSEKGRHCLSFRASIRVPSDRMQKEILRPKGLPSLLSRNAGRADRLTCDAKCIDIWCMRTTLEIDNDVLQAARDLARRQKKTLGVVISELSRRALTIGPDGAKRQTPETCLGFRPFPKRGGLVTNEAIDA